MTADIPLAELIIANGAAALRHNGDVFSTENIGFKLAARDLKTGLRGCRPVDGKSESEQIGQSFSKQDQSRFFERLDALAYKNQTILTACWFLFSKDARSSNERSQAALPFSPEKTQM